MTVSVLVPWRGGCPYRERAWEWVRACYAALQPNWEVVTGTVEGPWVKAAAVADALTRSAGDTLVVADADVWSPGTAEAVRLVAEGVPWVVPHLMVHRLGQQASSRVAATAAGAAPTATPDGLAERPYRGRLGGGIVVLTRSAYQQAPLDRRFVGWCREDDSWALALQRLVARPTRLGHPLWHLWHPPQDRTSRQRGSPANEALWRRYVEARTPAAMQRLVEEAA